MKDNCSKFFKLLGLCQRAGKLVSGEMMSEVAIRSGDARLVIISEEASSNTLKKFIRMCKNRKIKTVVLGKKETLGRAIGKPSRTVLVVKDKSFGDMLLGVLNREEFNMEVSD